MTDGPTSQLPQDVDATSPASGRTRQLGRRRHVVVLTAVAAAVVVAGGVVASRLLAGPPDDARAQDLCVAFSQWQRTWRDVGGTNEVRSKVDFDDFTAASERLAEVGTPETFSPPAREGYLSLLESAEKTRSFPDYTRRIDRVSDRTMGAFDRELVTSCS